MGSSAGHGVRPHSIRSYDNGYNEYGAENGEDEVQTITTRSVVIEKKTVYKKKYWSDQLGLNTLDICHRYGYNVEGLYVVPEFVRLLQSLNKHQRYMASRIIYPRDYSLSIKNDDTFDVIVVGSGAAGSVLAAKLSDEKDVNVLLLEAGGKPLMQSEIPGLWANSVGSAMDWNYVAKEDATFGQSMDGRRVRLVRGKCLGGNTALNNMMYDRGIQSDYVKFEQAGLTKWSFKDVLKFYKRSEDCRFEKITTDKTVRKSHRTGGKLCVDSFRNTRTVEIRQVYSKALSTVNYNTMDFFDVKNHKGFVSSVATVKEGLRVNAAKAFLKTADRKYNLKIAARSTVRRVLFEGTRAVGVEFENSVGELIRVKSKKHVVLSAGPIGSPQLLLQSGVGPSAALGPLGIPVVADRAHVGGRLQAHPQFLGLVVKFDAPPIQATSISDMVFEYLTKQTGPLATIGLSSFTGFVDIDGNGEPDVQIFFYYYSEDDTVFMPSQLDALGFGDAVTEQLIDLNDGADIQIVGVSLLRPKNTGRVTLNRTAVPGEYEPVIEFGSLDEQDVGSLLKAVEWVKKVVRSEAFKPYGPTIVPLTIAGGPKPDAESAEYWRYAIKHLTSMNVQMAGTCAMAAGQATGVVSEDLNVFGLQGIKVADSSVLPALFSAESSAPTMMVAEKASDIIKKELGCQEDEEQDDSSSSSSSSEEQE